MEKMNAKQNQNLLIQILGLLNDIDKKIIDLQNKIAFIEKYTVDKKIREDAKWW
jgi:hypothetical protein